MTAIDQRFDQPFHEIRDLRAEMRAGFAELRAEMAALRTEITTLKDRLVVIGFGTAGVLATGLVALVATQL